MDKYIGRLLDGRYEILEILGTGGMAVVYKARCHRLNRLVAIKILKDEFARDEEFRRRFRAEGEAVAMLSPPNIVQVFDGSSSDSADYIVMELIDGISLKQYMEKRGSLNWKETLHFAMQIATGLEHAHSRSIVHRDIKPHNVMVLKNGSVKVMDFGIARVMSKSSTLTKEALGSVHYISPEQAKGSFTDNRSDIYSLGVVMYEMMTGRPPYDGESAVAVAIQHINGGAVLPSVLNPNIPKALEQIIRKAMALELKDRYSSATEMLRDMEEFRKDPAVGFSHKIPEQPARPAIPIPNPSRPVAERTVQQRPVQPRPQQEPPKRRPPQPQHQEPPRRKTAQQRKAEERSRMTGIAVVVCSIVAILSLVAILVSLRTGDRFGLFGKDKGLVEVPYLVGKVYSDEIAAENPGLVFRHLPQEYSSVYPAGQVIRQEPAGGSRVAEGTEVVITLSLGEKPPARTMEDLAGVSKEEAVSFLTGQGFLTLVRNETSDVYGVDQVIRTEPSAGTPLEEGQTIYLWVSIGPKMVLGEMPDVIGMPKDVAIRVLNGLKFENIRLRAVPSGEIPGTVIYQSEEAGTEIDVTTEILLEYAQDPSETLPADEEGGSYSSEFVSFPLPVREEPYELTIYREGILVLDPTQIQLGTNKYTLELKGRGKQTFELYIDGVLYTTKTVEFGANE